MTQTLRIVLVGLVAILMSQATFAQYAASAQQMANMEETTKTVHDGQRLTNVGKTIMLSGASSLVPTYAVHRAHTLSRGGWVSRQNAWDWSFTPWVSP